MKFYLCGAIRGGRELQTIYQTIHEYLLMNGHIILDHHISSPDVLEIEDLMTDKEIYKQDIQWLKECHGVIAEVSIPSLGVGYEISYALNYLNKPVLGLFNRSKTPISAMISGNTSKYLTLCSYNDVSELLNHIQEFITYLEKR
ncbi:MAG: nucleoside 2-deoxyribosyltransferase [Candidatus Hodarchaeota archaeon]